MDPDRSEHQQTDAPPSDGEQRSAAGAGTPPSGGWQLRGEQQPTPEALADVLEQLVAVLPADLQQRLVQAVHELLEAIRALIDWWLARIEQQRSSGPVAVRDIPIL